MKMHTNQKRKIFISYAREDGGLAARLYGDLKSAGCSPWMDMEDLLPGERWRAAIKRAIRDSEYTLVLMSSKSVGKRGFVQKEIRQALETLEEHSGKTVFLIPVRLDECYPLHDELEELNWVDLFPSYEKGFQKLVRVFRPDSQSTSPDQVAAIGRPSQEAAAVLNEIRSGTGSINAIPRKLDLLSEKDRAHVLDSLVEESSRKDICETLLQILSRKAKDIETIASMTRLLRKITLTGTVDTKALLMKITPPDLLIKVEEGLRITFFSDIIHIMNNDQFNEVNKITPAVVLVHTAIPGKLRRAYLEALLVQTDSGAYQGAPAARRALRELPDDMVDMLMSLLDRKELSRHQDSEPIRRFLEENESRWPPRSANAYRDYITLSFFEFLEKAWRAEENDAG